MSERITFTLHEVVALMDAYADRALRDRFGVTFSQFEFLATLSTMVEPNRPDVTEFAACLGVSKAAVSKRVPGLVARGWVATVSDPAHARRVVLSLTPAGEALVREAGDVLDAAFAGLFTHLPHVDLARLHDDLRTLRQRLQEKGTLA